jgi:hypothetical protein
MTPKERGFSLNNEKRAESTPQARSDLIMLLNEFTHLLSVLFRLFSSYCLP